MYLWSSLNIIKSVFFLHQSCGKCLADISLHLLSLLCLVRFKDSSNTHIDDVRPGVHYLVCLGALQARPSCQTIFCCKEPGQGGKDKGRASRIPRIYLLELLPRDSNRLGEHGAVVLDGGQLTPGKLGLHRSKLFPRQSLVCVSHLQCVGDWKHCLHCECGLVPYILLMIISCQQNINVNVNDTSWVIFPTSNSWWGTKWPRELFRTAKMKLYGVEKPTPA